MYDQYYDHLKEYFGKVIKMSFYDEPVDAQRRQRPAVDRRLQRGF